MSHSLASKTDDAMKCRVFIGNLPNDAVTKDLLKSMFVQYGSYMDCSIYKNFGFVQYNDEQSATKAVQATNGSMMFDRRLDVKIAAAGRKDQKGMQTGGVAKSKKPRMPMNDMRPMLGRQPFDPNMPYHQPVPLPPAPYAYQQQVPPMAGYPIAQAQNGIYPMQPLNSTRPPSYTSQSQPSSSAQQSDQGNNKYCDIVCTNKKQQPYAEFVEFTFARLGFVCSIVSLAPNYSVDTFLNRSSRDGVPVAVSLKDDNENHRSINLHIFVGSPEEHRNMPLDVAEQFLKKRFNFANSAQASATAAVANSSNPSTGQNMKSFSYSTQSNSNANNSQNSNQTDPKAPPVDNKSIACDVQNVPHNYAYSNYYGAYRGTATDPYYHNQQPGSYSQLGSGAQPPYPGVAQYPPSNSTAMKRN